MPIPTARPARYLRRRSVPVSRQSRGFGARRNGPRSRRRLPSIRMAAARKGKIRTLSLAALWHRLRRSIPERNRTERSIVRPAGCIRSVKSKPRAASRDAVRVRRLFGSFRTVSALTGRIIERSCAAIWGRCQADGVVPKVHLKTRPKWLWSANPASWAAAAMPSPLRSSCRAWASLRHCRYR